MKLPVAGHRRPTAEGRWTNGLRDAFSTNCMAAIGQVMFPVGVVAILLAGGPGAGKSSVSQALRDRGLSSIDLDEECARWEDESGQVVGLPRSPTRRWLDHHFWRWGERLDQALVAPVPQPTLFVGAAADMFEYLVRFDLVVLLRLDSQCQRTRLAHAARDNEFGKFGETADWSDDYRARIESALLERGACPVDARPPLDLVVEAVLATCRNAGLALDASHPSSR